ncbi:PqiC family protein [Skermanella rosea]|uniref:PqiC family protein n=1 Tax=Skermanella rosea TaxID=1817965 RepID=UPI001932E658|nr:PqiC family protein [Skermanella rosea]UEM02643.1 PqiC family protein [Skermanella rosea]
MRRFRLGLLALLVPLVAACAATLPPPDLHVLSSLPREAATGPGSPAAARGPAVGVEQANIPEYLDRPEIVTRSGANTIQVSQGDRWGQRLQGDVTRVVADNLRGLLPSDNVFVLPLRRREQLTYTVTLDVTSFERDASGDAVLNAYWSVLDAQTEAERAGARARYVEPVEGEGIEATVAAMNRALNALSRDIAAGIRRASARK